MAGIPLSDIDKYGSSQLNNFFGLADDGDKAIVRFLHRNMDDIDAYPIHSINYKGKDRKVRCLKTYSDPIDRCPMCQSGHGLSVRLYIDLYEYEVDKQGNLTGKKEQKIWDRGRAFVKQLQSLCNRYQPLCDYVFEIERCGKAKSPETTYMIYPVNIQAPFEGIENVQRSKVLGTIIFDKNAQEMNYFLENGDFPSAANDDADIIRREPVQPAYATQPAPTQPVYAQPVYQNPADGYQPPYQSEATTGAAPAVNPSYAASQQPAYQQPQQPDGGFTRRRF